MTETEEFEKALKIATAQVNSEGELIFYNLENAKQDEKAGCFSISIDELYKFFLAVKGVVIYR